MQKCPNCAEEIEDDVTICKHCRRVIAVAKPPRKMRPAGRTAAIGVGCFALAAIVIFYEQGAATPTTKIAALLPALIGGLAIWAAIILFIIAIIQVILNKMK